MKMNSSRILLKAQKGQSLVELAASLILLLILLAGIFDLGRAIIAYFILQDAAEEGIVYGTSFPTDCNQIALRIAGDVDQSFFKSVVYAQIKIQDSSGGYTACNSIAVADVYATKIMQIKVTTDFPITMPFLGTFIGQPCQDQTIGKQCIPLVVNTSGIILRPPPPT